MFRFLRFFLLGLVLAAGLALGVVLLRSGDALYTVQEWLHRPDFWEYDDLIVNSARRYAVDPMLIKAVVWRESKFSPRMVGTSGERGLMQVMDAAGLDWARAEKIETFHPVDLFDPKTNLDAGSWYVSKGLEHWREKDDPIPFALAEFNAGRRRVDRWIGEAREGGEVSAQRFLETMDFPRTKQYIGDVTGRYRFYRQRGRL